MENNNTSIDAINKPKYNDLHSFAQGDIKGDNIYDGSVASYNAGNYTHDKESIISVSTGTDCVVSVFDVATYILKKIGRPCSTMKLHKLLYYCQAWNLVWEEKPLFKEPIEAWANGPVVRSLFAYHRGIFELSYREFSIGNENLLTAQQKENVDSVLDFYGNKSAQWLIDQTHIEDPWVNARKGLEPGERGSVAISLDSMLNYYSSL